MTFLCAMCEIGRIGFTKAVMRRMKLTKARRGVEGITTIILSSGTIFVSNHVFLDYVG